MYVYTYIQWAAEISFHAFFFHEIDSAFDEFEQSSSINGATLAFNVKHPNRRALSLIYRNAPFVTTVKIAKFTKSQTRRFQGFAFGRHFS